MFQNCSGTKRSKQRCSKLYRNEEEEQMVFQIFSGTKRNKHRYYKAIQKQRGTNQIIPILFRTKVEQTNLFQNFSRSNWNKPKKSKKEKCGTKRKSSQACSKCVLNRHGFLSTLLVMDVPAQIILSFSTILSISLF